MKLITNAGDFAGRVRETSHVARQMLTNRFTLVTLVAGATLILCASGTALAQGTGGGGTSIFGQDETMIPNAVRYAVVFLFGIAFLFGAGSVVWGVMAYTRRQECMNWIIGGGLCMVVGGVVAGIVYIAGGNSLAVPTDLSYLASAVAGFA